MQSVLLPSSRDAKASRILRPVKASICWEHGISCRWVVSGSGQGSRCRVSRPNRGGVNDEKSLQTRGNPNASPLVPKVMRVSTAFWLYRPARPLEAGFRLRPYVGHVLVIYRVGAVETRITFGTSGLALGFPR